MGSKTLFNAVFINNLCVLRLYEKLNFENRLFKFLINEEILPIKADCRLFLYVVAGPPREIAGARAKIFSRQPKKKGYTSSYITCSPKNAALRCRLYLVLSPILMCPYSILAKCSNLGAPTSNLGALFIWGPRAICPPPCPPPPLGGPVSL